MLDSVLIYIRLQAAEAVFPAILRIVPSAVFMKRNPIVLGVDVVEGILKIGTPLCVTSQGMSATGVSGGTRIIELGRVTSIERDHKPVTDVRPGGSSVAIKIEPSADQSYVMFGRHFDEKNSLYSRVCCQCLHFRHASHVLFSSRVHQSTC